MEVLKKIRKGLDNLLTFFMRISICGNGDHRDISDRGTVLFNSPEYSFRRITNL